MTWYHDWWPWQTSKRVEWFVSISWVSCFSRFSLNINISNRNGNASRWLRHGLRGLCFSENWRNVSSSKVSFFSNIYSGTGMRINCELNANDFSLQDCIRPYRFLSEFRSNLVICCPATPFGLRTKLDFLLSHQFITFILNCQTNYLMWPNPHKFQNSGQK